MERAVRQTVGIVARDGPVTAIAHGTPVRVAYLEEPRGPVFRSTVRYVDLDHVRLDLVALPNSQLPPQPGDRVLLVVQREASVRAFEARVAWIEFAPPALVITTPIEARRDERRRTHRVNCAIPLRTGRWSDSPRGEFPLDGIVVDISIGGLQLHAKEGVPTGATLRLAFAVRPDEPDIEVTGVVVSSALETGLSAKRIHVQFFGADRPTLLSIVRFVRETRRAERNSVVGESTAN